MARQIWIYPALIAVLGQNRRPSFAEMRNLVSRLRREVSTTSAPGAIRRRNVRHLVTAALKVSASQPIPGE